VIGAPRHAWRINSALKGIRVHTSIIIFSLLFVVSFAQHLAFSQLCISSLLGPRPYRVMHFGCRVDMVYLHALRRATLYALLIFKPRGPARRNPLPLILPLLFFGGHRHITIICCGGLSFELGGSGEIPTRGAGHPVTSVFKTAALEHSATLPNLAVTERVERSMAFTMSAFEAGGPAHAQRYRGGEQVTRRPYLAVRIAFQTSPRPSGSTLHVGGKSGSQTQSTFRLYGLANRCIIVLPTYRTWCRWWGTSPQADRFELSRYSFPSHRQNLVRERRFELLIFWA
jgi:hypothetical protein